MHSSGFSQGKITLGTSSAFSFSCFNLVKCNLTKFKLSGEAVHKLNGQAVHKLSGQAVHKRSGQAVHKRSGQAVHKLSS